MARLALPDLFLDTSPYNAGTIASDAIRMGLPMITLSGESFASRMAGRLLQAIGASAGITETLDGYIETAVMPSPPIRFCFPITDPCSPKPTGPRRSAISPRSRIITSKH
jgi:hypothetical protein